MVAWRRTRCKELGELLESLLARPLAKIDTVARLDELTKKIKCSSFDFMQLELV